MSRSLMTRIEDRYVFTISAFYWRISVALAVLGVAAGILIFVAGAIPATKEAPEKGKYPPIASVTAEEIRARVAPAPEQVKEAPPKRGKHLKGQAPAPAPAAAPHETGSKDLDAAFAALRAVLPEPKFAWASSGRWLFYGPYNWQKNWVSTTGIPDRINEACKEGDLSTDTDQAQFIKACAEFLKAFAVERREEPFAAALKVVHGGLTRTLDDLRVLSTLETRILKDRTDLVLVSAELLKANPEAPALFEYTVIAADAFDPTVRTEVFATMVRSYFRRFDRKLDRLKEFTDQFLPMAKGFEARLQPAALDQCYDLAVARNTARQQQIRHIDEKYDNELSRAEAKYSMDNGKKANLRMMGLYGVGGGITSIAFVAILLVLLSIQRYLRKLVELQTQRAAVAAPETAELAAAGAKANG